MSSNFAALFSAIVAYILLILYSGTVISMTKGVIEHGRVEADKDKDGKNVEKKKIELPSGVINVVTIIGGLISALVVSRLALTKPGNNPTLIQLSQNPSSEEVRLSNWITGAYLIGWLLTGLVALIFGVMVYPDTNSTLGEIGTTWLGTAVACGYAYFGIARS